MNIWQLFRRKRSSEIARERLQILLAHERRARENPDLVDILRSEILAAVAKYVPVAIDQVDVTMNRGDRVSTLQIDVQIPV